MLVEARRDLRQLGTVPVDPQIERECMVDHFELAREARLPLISYRLQVPAEQLIRPSLRRPHPFGDSRQRCCDCGRERSIGQKLVGDTWPRIAAVKGLESVREVSEWSRETRGRKWRLRAQRGVLELDARRQLSGRTVSISTAYDKPRTAGISCNALRMLGRSKPDGRP